MKCIRTLVAGGTAVATLVLGLTGAGIGQTVTALPSVDLNRFAGSWYEIASLPSKREKGCIADTTDLIALGDKRDRLTLVNSCHAKNDYTNVRNADIKVQKNSGGGKLKVTYIWPFSDKVWVLGLEPNYQWVLLGSPNHKALRVLARTRSLGPDVLSEIRQKATSEGYPTDKLMMTLQTGR